MRLTERQCWDTIRAMVRVKNDEYSSLLYSLFDSVQMREVLGYTRDAFLSKMHFNSLSEFNTYVKKQNKTLSSQWLDNLSSEDLVLFLDFRCRFLQEIYNYYQASGGRVSRNDIKKIVENTKVSKLKGYNYGRLRCTGKPTRHKGEKKIDEIYLQTNEMQSQALEQVLERIAIDYQDIQNASNSIIDELVGKIVTSNIDLRGNLTGHRFKGKLNDSEQLDVPFKPKYAGLDFEGTPVYEHEDGYYTSAGRKLGEDERIYNEEMDVFGV
ncbi:MAG: hypothetical protein IJ371_05005 [Clostridia bacterium]|nr:hypothetical protein [Clostridia bacterium]